MVDLSTQYLGLKLKNPLVASASPISKKLSGARKLEDAGVSAIVMYSLFEEQIEYESRSLDHFLNVGTESFAESLTYFPEMPRYNIGPEGYLDLINQIKQQVQIPVIGSLNGISSGGWVDYARRIEEAGADGLELNIYNIPTDLAVTSAEIEDGYVELVRTVKSQIKIPLAVKLSPFFTSLPNLANRLSEAGANGLVLFNRFYQPDLDIETLEVVPNLVLSEFKRDASAVTLGGHSAWTHQSRPGALDRCAYRHRCRQSAHGWCQCGHDHLRAASPWCGPRR